MSSGKRVAIYTDDSSRYGVGQYTHAIACALVRGDYHVTCIQARNDNPLFAERIQLGVEHIFLDDPDFARAMGDPSDGLQALGKSRPDLVLFSNCCPLSNFASKGVAMRRGLRFITVDQFVTPQLAERFAPYLDELGRHYAAAQAAVAVSQENLELLRKHYRLAADQGQVIYYGRPDSFFAPRDAQICRKLRDEIGLADDAVLCFTAARLEAVKGHRIQIEAMKLLFGAPIWPRLHFAWVGTGPAEATLRQKVADEGVAAHVHFLGERDDVAGWLDAVDMFLLTSHAEGMPLAIMEAMAKGVPVAASAVSGIPEELGDAGRMLPAPAGDARATAEALASVIVEWSADEQLRLRIGAAGRERADKLFREQRMIDQTLQLVAQTLSSPLPPQPAPTLVDSNKIDPIAQPETDIQFEPGDYVSPGLARVSLGAAFPNVVRADHSKHPWPWLRREVPHTSYVDRRAPGVGLLTRDEAHVLYNTALQFRGQRALEIGCWIGWSTCHLALAGVLLDVVDPLLSTPHIHQTVVQSLTSAGVIERVKLVVGQSPEAIFEMAARWGRTWSLIFIDGNHDAPAPLRDAMTCELLAAPDAAVLFHDLASPEVAEGLHWFRERGWNTLIYQTMQIMGVAWRGDCRPIRHHPDPAVKWSVPSHLRDYAWSG